MKTRGFLALGSSLTASGLEALATLLDNQTPAGLHSYIIVGEEDSWRNSFTFGDSNPSKEYSDHPDSFQQPFPTLCSELFNTQITKCDGEPKQIIVD